MLVSPFSPIFFIDSKADGVGCPYIQTFSPYDVILLQLIGTHDEDANAYVIDLIKNETLFKIGFSQWDINEDSRVLFSTLSMSPGFYSIKIDGIGQSEPFRVTSDASELRNTTLIQYSMKDNRQRNDAVFFIDSMQYFFDFRVPGGFKDSNWGFAVESEQFTTDASDIIQLFSLDSVQQKFTLGNSQGCPVWFAAMLNRLLCCDYIYFDGKRYARKDTSVPEMTATLDGINSFVFAQNLQRVINIDPTIEQNNLAIIRRVDEDKYRAVDSNINRLIK